MTYRMEMAAPQISGIVSKRILKCIWNQEAQYLISSAEAEAESLMATIARQASQISEQACTLDAISAASAKSIAVMSQKQLDWCEFVGHLRDWNNSRNRVSSFAKDLIANQGYLNIIGMGDRAVPCILRQLQDELRTGEPDHWFVALSSITKENPVPPESQGKIHEMAKAWLDWGMERGHLNAEGVGGTVSGS